MNLERYPVKADDDFKRFEFFSEGPWGRIRKVVQFQQDGNDFLYNLAFGDWDEISGGINHNSRSNNYGYKYVFKGNKFAICYIWMV